MASVKKRGSKLKNTNVNLVMRLMKYNCINGRVGFSSFFFVFVFVFDTNNLLKNRITSGMHIYSSPRNMSVILGSVSTKHEQHLLPNRLYPQQIWHRAHSFFFFPDSLHLPYLLFFLLFFYSI